MWITIKMLTLNQVSSKLCQTLLRQPGCARCLHTAVRRWSKDDDDDDPEMSRRPGGVRGKSIDASKLLNVLADLKVEKTAGREDSLTPTEKKISVAANFQRIVARAEKRSAGKEKELTEETEEERSPGLEELQEMTRAAAQEVAQVYPDQETVESHLLKELRRHDDATAAGERGETDDISAILSGIRVQRQTSMEKQQDKHDAMSGRAQRSSPDQYNMTFASEGTMQPYYEGDQREVGRTGKGEPYQRQRKRTLFDRQRLDIFSPELDVTETQPEEKSVWEVELQKQLKALSYSTVRNGFEEAMKLTEEGKLWRYPIDNERGMEAEQDVGFHEHVFLDHHLAGFPQRRQVLDFMELVLIGLAKNPHLTVVQKQDHIAWFRDYFSEKEGIFEAVAEEEKKKEERSGS